MSTTIKVSTQCPKCHTIMDVRVPSTTRSGAHLSAAVGKNAAGGPSAAVEIDAAGQPAYSHPPRITQNGKIVLEGPWESAAHFWAQLATLPTTLKTHVFEGDFSGLCFDHVRLEDCTLNNARFDNATFHKTVFMRCSIDHASFRGARFRDADIVVPRGATIDFTHAVFTDVQFNRSDETNPNATFDLTTSKLDHVLFIGGSLYKIQMPTVITGLELRGTHTTTLTFTNSDLTSVVFKGGDHSGLNFERCRFTAVAWKMANCYSSTFLYCDLSNHDMTRVHFGGRPTFTGSTIKGLQLGPDPLIPVFQESALLAMTAHHLVPREIDDYTKKPTKSMAAYYEYALVNAASKFIFERRLHGIDPLLTADEETAQALLAMAQLEVAQQKTPK